MSDESSDPPRSEEQPETAGDPKAGDPKSNRRFLLKLAASGFVAAGSAGVAPVVIFGQQGPSSGGPSTKEPVDRPYSYMMSACNGLVNMRGWNAVYSFTCWGRFDITASDKATFRDLLLQGTFVSGTDHGPVTIRQTGESSGTYAGVKVTITCPVTYSDATIGSVDSSAVSSTLAISGDVFKGGSELTLSFHPDWPDPDDPPVIPIWSKATC